MNFGVWELVIILGIVALLFGTSRLRSVGGDLGQALKSFRGALKDDGDDDAKQTDKLSTASKDDQRPD
ncbi:MAG: twin-arginine translocase TatA/TatE family subunit [Gammaproteobacteria bacterium]